MTPEEFMRFAGVSRETLADFQSYHSIILKWQAKINLISPTTIDSIYERHFADSAQLFPYLSADDKEVVDLGSGGGFPGLALALIARQFGRPTIFHLVESDSRKAAFLIDVARDLRLLGATVRIHAVRAERLGSGDLAHRAGCVTARALAALSDLLGLAESFLTSDGRCVFLKGQRADDEISAARRAGWQFDLETHPSRLAGGGTVLVVSRIARVAALAASAPRKL